MEKVTALDGAEIANAVYSFTNTDSYIIVHDKNNKPVIFSDTVTHAGHAGVSMQMQGSGNANARK